MLVLVINVLILGQSFKKATLAVQAVPVSANRKTFTAEELKKYNGSDPTLPIYLSYEGNIYDVTAGKEFYQTGGPYHDLAGKDSTSEPNFAGGGIIKRKYPIIGKLAN